MRIGCPKEIKKDEYRVGLTPTSVRELTARGHEVMVESGAAGGIGVDDDHYRRAGAQVGRSAAEVWSFAEMIVKVKEPQAAEFPLMKKGQVLFTYLHLAPDSAQTKSLSSLPCFQGPY